MKVQVQVTCVGLLKGLQDFLVDLDFVYCFKFTRNLPALPRPTHLPIPWDPPPSRCSRGGGGSAPAGEFLQGGNHNSAPVMG